MEDTRLKRYIDSLSKEDREKYKSLIDDALRRDKQLTEVVDEAKRQAELYAENSKRMWETTRSFHAAIARLNETVAGIAEISRRADGSTRDRDVDEERPSLLH